MSNPAAASNSEPRKNSRRPFYLVLALFFVPLALAFLTYYGFDWRPAGNTSHGELITPARPLPVTSLPTPEGAATPGEFLQKKWSMVYLGNGACDADCRQALTDMRQVRLALNKDMTRVQRVFLFTGPCCDESYFSSEQAGLIRASLDTPAGAALLGVFPGKGVLPIEGKRIYLVDPLGNLMMSYPPHAAAKGMLEDLKKLLNLSHIG